MQRSKLLSHFHTFFSCLAHCLKCPPLLHLKSFTSSFISSLKLTHYESLPAFPSSLQTHLSYMYIQLHHNASHSAGITCLHVELVRIEIGLQVTENQNTSDLSQSLFLSQRCLGRYGGSGHQRCDTPQHLKPRLFLSHCCTILMVLSHLHGLR